MRSSEDELRSGDESARVDELFHDAERSNGESDDAFRLCDAAAIDRFREIARASDAECELHVYSGAGRYDHRLPYATELFAASASLTTCANGRTVLNEPFARALEDYRRVVRKLTGFKRAIANVYLRGSALGRAVASAVEIARRDLVLAPQTLNPDYARVVAAYARVRGFEFRTVPEKKGAVDLDALEEIFKQESDRVAATIVQYPNFYGALERVGKISSATRAVGAFLIAAVDPFALVLLKSPREWGADVATGDVWSHWNLSSCDAPHLGFIAFSDAFASRFSERAPSEFEIDPTLASRARSAFASALQLTRVDLRELADAMRASRAAALYAREQLAQEGFAFPHDAPFLREFAVNAKNPRELNRRLLRWGVVGGYELDDGILLAFTEKRAKEDIDELVYFMKEHQFGAANRDA